MNVHVTEVMSERHYKAGYVIKEEIWELPKGNDPTRMKQAYTPSGDYIGDTKWAYRLCKLRGIKPEKRTPDSNVCSIGFCEKEQKWYGWSHRAIYGFGIGGEVKPGDCGYMPTDRQDFILDTIRFWIEDYHTNVTGTTDIEDGVEGVRISWLYTDDLPNEKLRGEMGGLFQQYPDTYGRGEWTAETLEDAKQMAMDFAEGVS